MKSEIKSHQQSRSGITLLFTISMIVLFLLMGTTFVVVANNFFRASVRRGLTSVNVVDGDSLLDRAFFMAYRGPSLDDVNSPLRGGHSILEDMYGYGISGTLTGPGTPIGTSALISLNVSNEFIQLRDNAGITLPDNSYADGILNGRVITITSGEARGYSTRIVSHALFGTDLQIVIPRDKDGIDWAAVTATDTLIINGREFSGFGSGQIAGGPLPSPDAGPMSILQANSLAPNQIGVSRADLTAATGYASNSQGPNEPYDAPDHQNMLLAGEDIDGNPIPSGHRDRLYTNQPHGSVAEARQLTFRPIYLDADNDGIADPGSTATAAFDANNRFNDQTGDLTDLNSENFLANLEVDNDGDGQNDSVWIDIGLPIQTDNQGRKFRPLVAYRIVDMDGRLNLNAHGMNADTATGSAVRQGSGYGVPEISLSGVLGGQYANLLGLRYGDDGVPGNLNNALSVNYNVGQKLFGHPVPNTLSGFLFGTGVDFYASTSLAFPGANADEFPEFVGGTAITGVNNSVSPYLSDFSIGGGVGDSHIQPFEFESILRKHDVDSNLTATRISDALRSQLRTNSESLTTDSYEVAIPATPRSILELLRDRILARNGNNVAAMQSTFRILIGADPTPGGDIIQLISKEMLMGGRFDLNRALGNGVDDDGDGVIDDLEELELVAQDTSNPAPQHLNPVFDLDNQNNFNAGDSQAKSLMAHQLYVLALLTAGDDVATLPTLYPDLPAPAPAGSDVLSYRRAVAQWAVNIVDFRDPDSIMTVMEYDVDPFNTTYVDGDLTSDEGAERGIVYGAERPELLMTEASAYHDRQLADLATDPSGDRYNGGAGGDDDWDSPRLPQSSAFIELYHPYRQSFGGATGFQTLPNELIKETDFSSARPNNGVELDKRAPDDTPVWRILVQRGSQAATPNENVRSVFFVDPAGSPAPTFGDVFFPSSAFDPISPGGYAVIGGSGNIAGRNMTTFGSLSGIIGEPTVAEVNQTRSIELLNNQVVVRDWNGSAVVAQPARPCTTIVIDSSTSATGPVPYPRGFTLSDPNGGYNPANIDIVRDGIVVMNTAFPPAPEPRDRPFDAVVATSTTYRDADDIEAVWTNGVKKDGNYQFRVLRLQRLADPTSAYDPIVNPYITVDVANVDLLAYNGLANNPQNESDNSTPPASPPVEERGVTASGVVILPLPGDTRMGGIERGEEIAAQNDKATARRQLFRTGGRDPGFNNDIGFQAGDGHNLSYRFVNAGERLETLGMRNEAYNDTTPFGWLAWNNRLFANGMEIANVPMLSSEGIIRYFARPEADMPALGTTAESDDAFAFFFGDDQFAHLPGFGGVNRGGNFESNRFDRILEFVEVPNRFLGSETFLNAPVAKTGALLFNLNPPFHSIPNFRYPGKVNLNTIYEQDVWDAVIRGFGDAGLAGATGFNNFRADRNRVDGPTDFGGLYTTAEGGEFVEGSRGRKGALAGLFRRVDPLDPTSRVVTDSANDTTIGRGTDIGSAAFRNETRTRLGAAMTTRSSVFAFWITIGYFEVDEYGRVGAELGADEGQVRRNRAFYMVDRSIPVALEPGKNHNVEDAVLVRTILE